MARRLAAVFCAAALLVAHDVISTKITWSREVARLVYAHCVVCHRDGGSAFSLITYSTARPWAKAIRDEVLARRMPPWGAIRGFGDFTGDVSLSQEEMDTIAQWVEGGAPEGDPALLPKLPEAHPPFPSAPNGRHVIVQGSTRLDRATEILAILPDADAPQTTRIWAELPGGSITPLLWAYEYRRAFAHPFVFREPVQLPPGTRVASQPPLAFTLTTR